MAEDIMETAHLFCPEGVLLDAVNVPLNIQESVHGGREVRDVGDRNPYCISTMSGGCTHPPTQACREVYGRSAAYAVILEGSPIAEHSRITA